MVEFRRLIAFGKSSYVVSLPKSWVVRHKLGKGDLISLDETAEQIVVLPHASDRDEGQTTISIRIDDKSMPTLKRELIAAYLNNHSTIKISGKRFPQFAQDIRDVINNLMGLEIIEQTGDGIHAQDLLDMRGLSIESLVRKADVICRSILTDFGSLSSDEFYQSVRQRDGDVNRLHFLLFRTIKSAMQNPHLMRKLGFSSLELINVALFVDQMEKTVDGLKRLAKYVSLSKMSPEAVKSFSVILKEIESAYLDTMKSFFTNNKSLIHEVADRKYDIYARCDDFIDAYGTETYHANLGEILRLVSSSVHEMGRPLYS